ncbi:MAG: DNA mismatch repair endonuclease MutL, partial [Thermoanaerobaculia bacterium]
MVQVLPDILINQIAAGEVIERPASVVKELVENALDAGATRVTIEIEGGGVARISVSDDGSGMSAADARMALERHATSKIRTLVDLDGILTLGFRGEALPSIASVSRFTLTTSADDSGLGAELIVDQGAAPRAGAARQPKGTRVLVENLFGNVPARRKFLKSPDAEMRAVVRIVTTLALARPDVAFTLRSGARTLLELPVAPDFSTRFVETVGRSALDGVVLISSEAFGFRLTGAISRPDITFASRSYQWFYVNGRAAKDSSVAHAALLASREALRSDRFPAFVLFLTCDPAACDVNVHPQKHEVRFRDPSGLHSLVHRALLAALGGAKTADALTGERLTAPASSGWAFTRPAGTGPASAATAAMAEAIGLYDAPAGARQQESLIRPLPASLVRSHYGDGAQAPSPIGPLRLLGQYRNSFLIAEGDDGLVLIDQHVAHERVRYEKILAHLEETENAPAQSLLLPETFEASPDEAATLVSSEQLLTRAGFTFSELSGRVFLISATPAGTPPSAIVPFLRDLLARIPEGLDSAGEKGEEKRAKEILAASLACRGAITINTRISAQEATRLLTDLSGCEDPFTCPHGRPILLNLEHN